MNPEDEMYGSTSNPPRTAQDAQQWALAQQWTKQPQTATRAEVLKALQEMMARSAQAQQETVQQMQERLFPPTIPSLPLSGCAHVRWIVRDKDAPGTAFCEDCRGRLPLVQLLLTMRNRIDDTIRMVFAKYGLTEQSWRDRGQPALEGQPLVADRFIEPEVAATNGQG